MDNLNNLQEYAKTLETFRKLLDALVEMSQKAAIDNDVWTFERHGTVLEVKDALAKVVFVYKEIIE